MEILLTTQVNRSNYIDKNTCVSFEIQAMISKIMITDSEVLHCGWDTNFANSLKLNFSNCIIKYWRLDYKKRPDWKARKYLLGGNLSIIIMANFIL